MIALGITTYNRPHCLERSLCSVFNHLSEAVDVVYVHDDGSDRRYRNSYHALYDVYPGFVLQPDPVNRGVAHARNALLRSMLAEGADWCFLLEDDIEVTSSLAILGYLAACEQSGWQHLSFAHHGPWASSLVETAGSVSLYKAYIGAFCVYSREALEVVGLFDEHFRNAYDHVQHTIRLARAGFTDPRPFHAADATGSERWLREIHASSPIRNDPNWQKNIMESEEYWRTTDPDTYHYLWPQTTG